MINIKFNTKKIIARTLILSAFASTTPAQAGVDISSDGHNLSVFYRDLNLNDNIHEYIDFRLEQSEADAEPKVSVFAKKGDDTFSCWASPTSAGSIDFSFLELQALNIGRMGNLSIDQVPGLYTDIKFTHLSNNRHHCEIMASSTNSSAMTV